MISAAIRIAPSFQGRGSHVIFEEYLVIVLQINYMTIRPDIIHFKEVDRFDRFFFDLSYIV